MDINTFNYKNQLVLNVQPGAVKVLAVQPNAAFATVEVKGTGLLKLGLDVPKVLGPGKHDLESMNDTLVNAVFRNGDPIPVVSLTRLDNDGGKDDNSAPPACPVPAGPSLK